MAVAAIGGTADVMDHVATGSYEMVGTFNGNPVATADPGRAHRGGHGAGAYEKIEKLPPRAVSGIRTPSTATG